MTMSKKHLSEDTLAAYVMDHLDAAASERVERHVASCERCALALEREARLEVASSELMTAQLQVPPFVTPRARAWRAPLAGGLTLAAAAVLALVWQGSLGPGMPTPPVAPELGAHTGAGAAAYGGPAMTVSAGPTTTSSTASAPGRVSQAPPECEAQIGGLVDALAIPHAQSGDIEIVLTNHAASCRYWADKHFDNSCDVWRTRITLPPEAQKPGVYRVEQSFAHLDQRTSTSKGAWQKGAGCRTAGGRLSGTLRIERVESNRIIGSICGSQTDSTSNDSLVDGRFSARRCPSCAGTGDGCASNADCCANACVSGRCIP
jgi:hypothetical protein